jgi:hypothetical protein
MRPRLSAPRCSTMNNRGSPGGEVTNKGRVSPEAMRTAVSAGRAERWPRARGEKDEGPGEKQKATVHGKSSRLR